MRPPYLGWALLGGMVVSLVLALFAVAEIRATAHERHYYITRLARADSMRTGLRCEDQPRE